jgi:hypothetical protein
VEPSVNNICERRPMGDNKRCGRTFVDRGAEWRSRQRRMVERSAEFRTREQEKEPLYYINVLVINNSFTAVNNRNESSLSLRKESCGSSRGGDV